MEVEPYFRNAYGNLTNSGWNSLPVSRPPFNKKRKLNFKSQPKYAKKQKVASRTRTMLKKKNGRQIPVGGGDSVSYFTRKNKPTSAIVKLSKELPVASIVQNFAGRVECAVGAQGYFLLGDYFTVADVNLGHVLLAGNGAGAPQGAKTVFKSVHSEGMITNMENVNARITIYDCIARKDTDATVTSPLTAISTGYNDISGGSSTDSIIVGGTPFGIPRFTEYFEVLQTSKVILSPGACHTHVVHYEPQKLLSKIISARVAGTGIGRVTVFTIVKFHGTPINDLTTQTQVSTSHIALDYVQSEEYKVNVVSVHLPFIDVNDTLPAAFTVAGNTMQDDGVELPENEA